MGKAQSDKYPHEQELLKDAERVHNCLHSKLTVDFKVESLENEIFNLQQSKNR